MRLFPILVLLIFSSAANAAPASDSLSITPPKARSADQIECLKQNADNHSGYLACIRAKKGLKDDDSQNNKSAPTAPMGGDTNSGGIR